jgi:NAD(P)H-hydrate epimerase
MNKPRVISRERSRQLDRRAVEEYGMTGVMLMENAGRGTTDILCQLGVAGPVVVVCGRGNNGGDGFVIARHLDLRGYEVRVVLLDDTGVLQGDAAINYQVLAKSDVPIVCWDLKVLSTALHGAGWIVDAMLGTGATGNPREPFSTVITELNESGIPILAVDIPSGLDCETGTPGKPTIRAKHTCTFVAAKPGLLVPTAAPYVGTLHVVDIGAPRKLVEECLDCAKVPQ